VDISNTCSVLGIASGEYAWPISFRRHGLDMCRCILLTWSYRSAWDLQLSENHFNVRWSIHEGLGLSIFRACFIVETRITCSVIFVLDKTRMFVSSSMFWRWEKMRQISFDELCSEEDGLHWPPTLHLQVWTDVERQKHPSLRL
jgi:hypothetical protein